MPTYQYSCTECGESLEIKQSFSDNALTTCPTCQGRLRKVFNAVGVVFKGSGFYRNDSRPSSESSTTSESKPSGDTKTDTKPAADSKPSPDTKKAPESKPKPVDNASKV